MRRRGRPTTRNSRSRCRASNGNLDIYLLELGEQQLTRLTDDPAIDTEAVFSPDGSGIYFTSDRSGNPQIYSMTLGSSERPQRITFSNAYNARPRISPDGKQLALLTLDNGSYRIGVQDLASGTVHAAVERTPGRIAELCAQRRDADLRAAGNAAQGVLQTMSIDGLTSLRLDADAGEVREPVWGPFLP